MHYDLAIIGNGMVSLELIRALKESRSIRVAIIAPWADKQTLTYGTSFRYQGMPPFETSIGGRSHCWEGVCVPLESELLRKWPKGIHERLISQSIGSYYDKYLQLTNDGFFSFGAESGDSYALSLRTGMGMLPVPLAAKNTMNGVLAYSPLPWVNDVLFRCRGQFDIVDAWCDSIRSIIKGLEICCSYPNGSKIRLKASKILVAAGGVQSACLISQYLGYPESSIPLSDHLAFGILVKVSKIGSRIGERGFFFHPNAFGGKGNLFVRISETRHHVEVDSWLMAAPAPSLMATLDLDSRIVSRIPEIEVGHLGQELLDDFDGFLKLLIPGVKCMVGDALLHKNYTNFNVAYSMPGPIGTESARCCCYVQPLGAVDHEGFLPEGFCSIDEQFRVNRDSRIHAIGTYMFPSLGHANPSFTLLSLASQFSVNVCYGGVINSTSNRKIGNGPDVFLSE